MNYAWMGHGDVSAGRRSRISPRSPSGRGARRGPALLCASGDRLASGSGGALERALRGRRRGASTITMQLAAELDRGRAEQATEMGPDAGGFCAGGGLGQASDPGGLPQSRQLPRGAAGDRRGEPRALRQDPCRSCCGVLAARGPFGRPERHGRLGSPTRLPAGQRGRGPRRVPPSRGAHADGAPPILAPTARGGPGPACGASAPHWIPRDSCRPYRTVAGNRTPALRHPTPPVPRTPPGAEGGARTLTASARRTAPISETQPVGTRPAHGRSPPPSTRVSSASPSWRCAISFASSGVATCATVGAGRGQRGRRGPGLRRKPRGGPDLCGWGTGTAPGGLDAQAASPRRARPRSAPLDRGLPARRLAGPSHHPDRALCPREL